MKNKRKRSILSTLFIPYTTLFLVSFIGVIGFFVLSETNRIRENSFASIENNLISTSDNIDQMVNSLDSTSQNVLYSNLVKDYFSKYIKNTDVTSPSGKYSNTQNTKALYDILIALLGPNSPVDQLYLYGLSYGCFGVGLDNNSSLEKTSSHFWYEDTIKNKAEKNIYIDHDERLFPYFSYEEGRYFLTLVREYFSSLNVPQGIIEVKTSIMPIVNTIEAFNLNYEEEFYIYAPNGDLIYPINSKEVNTSSYYKSIQDHNQTEELMDKCFYKRVDGNYIFYQTSNYSHITTAVVVKANSLMSPIQNYVATTLLILLAVCIAIVILSYIISQRLSKPIGLIYSQVSSFQVNSDSLIERQLPDITISVLELDVLYHALIRMQTQARTALENELKLQNKEMESRMLALQAQMNPHFLHNSLATIQAMAADGMTEEIDTMCQNISSILRYISSDSEQLVPIAEELLHTKEYLECMRVRYDNELDYSIDIPEEMMNCKIPKLCLQLIVENAIKFSTQKRGPWMVNVKGRMTPFDWELQIKDNGPGFTNEELKDLQAKIEQINKTGTLPNLEINGMGLMNIYIRLKLLYKQAPIYRLTNNVPEGASVTIGGGIL